ncbi:MAG: serine/threonine-protein kinase [bacterium]
MPRAPALEPPSGPMSPDGEFPRDSGMGTMLVPSKKPVWDGKIPDLPTEVFVLSLVAVGVVLFVIFLMYRTLRLFLIKRAEVKQGRGGADGRRVAQLEQERDHLRGRVQNLERVLSNLSLELNGRIERLADKQSQLAFDATVTPAGLVRAGAKPLGSGGIAEDLSNAATMALQAPRGELPSGSQLMDRFEVERPLGRGGMGAVYLANDKRIGERVALKVISRELAEDPAAVERFRREAGAARKITHPNVIRIHDLGEDGGMLFLSMEYFAGQSLSELLAQRHVLGLDEAREILRQVCDALTAAHAAGVVHRDLKPQNVLVNERGETRVIDFGLAKMAYLNTMTATGLMMGTPEYMSPEQVRGRAVDHRADIYSLGAMAYHMLCGRPPFTADTPIAVGFMHVSESPSSPRLLQPELPESVDGAILKALSKDPDDRFDAVADFKAAL